MDIGIMSMQRIYNYGSWMQSFALKNILLDLGESVQFVDYHIGKPKFESVKECGIYYLKYSKHFVENILSSNEVLAKLTLNDFIVNEYYFKERNLKELLGGSLKKRYNVELDCLIVGSDEVFNCLQCSPRVGFSPELLGHYKHSKKKISYAASFGNVTMDKIKKSNKESEIAMYLSEFDAISVRDENSKKIVTELTGIEPVVNLDPVLMWDLKKVICDAKIKEKIDGRYLIVYTYPNRLRNHEGDVIRAYAKKHDLKIIGINAKYDFLDKMIYGDPITILKYFDEAECVITDTFHGSLFSIVNHKPFVSIVRSSLNGKYGNSEKLTDVLKRLKMEERILDDVLNLEDKMGKEINYCNVDKIIELERKKTQEYLINNVINY